MVDHERGHGSMVDEEEVRTNNSCSVFTAMGTMRHRVKMQGCRGVVHTFHCTWYQGASQLLATRTHRHRIAQLGALYGHEAERGSNMEAVTTRASVGSHPSA